LSNEDTEFIEGTETFRSVSNLCFISAIVFLIFHELGITDSFLNWIPSLATPIVLALLGIGLQMTGSLIRFSPSSDCVNFSQGIGCSNVLS